MGRTRSGIWGIGLYLILIVSSADAGGGWVSEPGHGSLQCGFDRKSQLEAKRRDTEGRLYEALNHLTHDFRFAYASGQIGLSPRVEAGILLSYLWASERFDAAAEEANAYYYGWSDVWVGLKYQVRSGAWPVAMEAVARLPYLYKNRDKDPTGLLNRDFALKGHMSHAFSRMYFSAMAGFKWREAAPANQIIYTFEVGGHPLAGKVGRRMSLKFLLDGIDSIGSDSPSTYPRDRFPGLTLETGGHFFNFNRASSLYLQVSCGYTITPSWNAQVGLGYFAWGKSIVVYIDPFAQVGYNF